MMNLWFDGGYGRFDSLGSNLTLLLFIIIGVIIYLIWRDKRHHTDSQHLNAVSTKDLEDELKRRQSNADLAQQIVDLKEQLQSLKDQPK